MSAPPVRWAFVGASTWASRYLIPAVRAQPDAIGVGAFSSSRERGEEFAASNGLEKAYASLAELLADDAVDAVYISTTNDLHAPQTIAAAAAGKHVLCEKPLALTLADALRMREACEAAGVVFATDHHLRAAPTLVAMRELIAAGEIGELVAGRVFHARLLLEELRTWRLERPEAGGGVVLDITVHDADAVRFLFDDEVAEVTAMSANQGLAGAGIEDSVMGVMRLRGGQLVSFHDAFTVPHAGTGVEVHGSEGSLIGRDLLMPDPVGEVLLRRGDELEEVAIADRRPIYEEVVRRFDAAVRGAGEPLASGADGIASLAVAIAALESSRTGRAVKI
ncbi:MAG: Gfo/Idh/MocA family oxidoreductase [Actinobacteria bacterium]|nr:Gfo/Idh/MocA family oxidoreductase [Actinomycetota bacterium]